MTFAWIGWIAACLSGLGMPSFVFLIGNVIDSFDVTRTSKDDMLTVIKRMCWILVLIGTFVWIMTYTYYANLLYFSEVVSKKTRVKYL